MPDAKNKAADAIIETALRKDKRISGSTRTRIARILKTYPRDRWLEEISHVISDESAEFASTLRKVMEGGYVVGAAQVAKKLPDAAEPGQREIQGLIPFAPLQIEKPHMHEPVDALKAFTYVDMPRIRAAVESINDKAVMNRGDYDVLSDDAKARAFTIAGIAEVETIEQIRQAMSKAVDDGLTLKQTQDLIAETVDGSDLGPARSEAVFRTTVQAAYADGLDAMLDHPLLGDSFPFIERQPIADGRLSELCADLARSGIQETGIFLRADPVWKRTRPPSHVSCRCNANPLTVEAAAEKGIRYAQEWLERGRAPYPPAFVAEPDVKMPKGWMPGGTNL